MTIKNLLARAATPQLHGPEALCAFLDLATGDPSLFPLQTVRETLIYPLLCAMRQTVSHLETSPEYLAHEHLVGKDLRGLKDDLERVADLDALNRSGDRLLALLSALHRLSMGGQTEVRRLTREILSVLEPLGGEALDQGAAKRRSLSESDPFDEEVYLRVLSALLQNLVEHHPPPIGGSIEQSQNPDKIERMRELNRRLLHRLIALFERVGKDFSDLDDNVFAPLLRDLASLGGLLEHGERGELNDGISRLQHFVETSRTLNSSRRKDYEIELLTLREKVKESENLARRDPLTGIYNRRAFDQELQRLLERRAGEGTFALLFIDCDHFKTINDTHGHTIGDVYLKAVAKKLQILLRTDDFLARFGGDEFVAIFPSCEADLAARIAHRLFDHLSGTELELGTVTLSLSLSMGLALSQPEDTMKSLLDRADAALYRSKETGRNKLTVAFQE